MGQVAHPIVAALCEIGQRKQRTSLTRGISMLVDRRLAAWSSGKVNPKLECFTAAAHALDLRLEAYPDAKLPRLSARPRPTSLKCVKNVHPLVDLLIEQIRIQQVSCPEVAERSGVPYSCLKDWVRGKEPFLVSLEAALEVVGYRLRLVSLAGTEMTPGANVSPAAHPIVHEFFQAIQMRGVSVAKMARYARTPERTVSSWAHGTQPGLAQFAQCLASLGLELKIEARA